MIVADRKLSDAVGDAHRKLSLRNSFAGQNIQNGVSALGSGKPDLQDRFGLLRNLAKVKRPAVEENHDNVRIHLIYGTEQLHLNFRKIQEGTARCFAGLKEMLAKRHDNKLGFPGCLDCGSLHFRQLFGRKCLIDRSGKSGEHNVISKNRTARSEACAGCIHAFFCGVLNGNGILGLAGKGPAGLQLPVLCIGADEGDFLRQIQRKKTVVLQKNEALRGSLSCKRPVLSAENHLFFLFRICVLIGILEQPEIVLQLQNTKYAFIDSGFVNFAVFHERFQISCVAAGHHVDVYAGLNGLQGSISLVYCVAVTDHFRDGGEVCDENPVKAEFLTKDLLHQPLISGCRNVIHGVEAGHDKLYTCIHGSLVGGKIVVAQCPLAELYRIVIAACLRSAVRGKMLDAGSDFAGGLHVIALEAFHDFSGKQAVEVRVLSGGFHNSAPPGVTHKIHHRRKGHMQTAGCGFFCGSSRALAGQSRIKGGTLGKRCREDGFQTMNDIQHEQHGNVVWLYGHCLVLNGF